MDHVAAILRDEVRVECSANALREKLASLAGQCKEDEEDVDLCLPYASKEALAGLLSQLQALDLPFGSEPEGWSPLDIFEQLRQEGLVSGKIKTIAWKGRGDAVLGEA